MLRAVVITVLLLAWIVALQAVFFVSFPPCPTVILISLFLVVAGLQGLWGIRALMRGGDLFSGIPAFVADAFRHSGWLARVVAVSSIGFGITAVALDATGERGLPSEAGGTYYKTHGGATTEIGRRDFQVMRAGTGRALGGACLVFSGLGLILSYAPLDREDDDEGDARGEGFWD